jgi:hypothetical protein
MNVTLTDGTTTATLPEDIQWINEFDWTPVVQDIKYSLAGSAIVQEGAKQAGREIVLATGDGTWVSRAEIIYLKTLADQSVTSMTLTLANGDIKTVIFDRGQAPIVAREVFRKASPGLDHVYTLEIRLIEVSI